MRLIEVELKARANRIRLVGHVEHGQNKEEMEVYFEFPERNEGFISRTADPFAIALLLPSMLAGEPLEIVPPVSDSLLFNLAGIRDIFHSWWAPQFQRVPILATPRNRPFESVASKAATFFSGGVDSFYTLLKRRYRDPLPAPLTHIIFMHGVEQSLDKSAGTQVSQQRAERIAAAIGVECLVGETNLRTLFPMHWERYYFGSVLAATAIALSKGFRYVCIPSSFTYHHQVPHGSSPLVDERFSTEELRVVHDGGEASRAEKTARIIDWHPSLVLENLRVCILNSGGDFNCGRCYKCIRTAIALKSIGVWDQASTFPDKSTAHWGDVVFKDHLVLTEENLALARERGSDPDLVVQLERIVRKSRQRGGLEVFARNSPFERLLPILQAARDRRWDMATARKARLRKKGLA